MLMLKKSCTSALGKKVPRLEVQTSFTSNRHTNTVNLSVIWNLLSPLNLMASKDPNMSKQFAASKRKHVHNKRFLRKSK